MAVAARFLAERPRLISVVVVTYNRADALLAVLRALAAQDDREFEVIVADDGSRVEQRALLDAAAPTLGLPLRRVWHPDRGFTAATARNLGTRLARGDYLLFIDGDCVPQPDFIRRHRQLARRGCFVNGSRVLLDPVLTDAVLAQRAPMPGADFRYWLVQRLRGHCNKLLALYIRWPARWRRAHEAFRWRGIRSCNLSVWRDDFIAINGFDETFNGWGHEDADFVLRLQRSGCARINGYWGTEVLHLWHREAAREAEQQHRARVHQRAAAQTLDCRAEFGLQHGTTPDSEIRVDAFNA